MRFKIAIVTAIVVLVGHGALRPTSEEVLRPQVVRIPSGVYSYRPAGEFRVGTVVVDAPEQQVRASTDLEVMKYQVSEADYAKCVEDRACLHLGGSAETGFAQTGVSYTDAVAYAGWFSDQTGQHWRLPTDAEWLRAATGRVNDDTLSAEANSSDPSRRWLAAYRREVVLRGSPDMTRHPFGHFPESSFGVADMAGNIWEWTETCFQNGILSAARTEIDKSTDYCGVRAVQGKHQSFVIEFVRDARSGGCASGIPPDYLGFRLVHED